MSGSILRVERRSRYTTVANEALEDERLSFKALGLLVYLLSKPDGWQVSYRHLVTTHADGETAVRSGLVELEEAGYLSRIQERDDMGRYGWVSILREVAPCGGNHGMENPSTENPRQGTDREVKTDVVTTEEVRPEVVRTPSSTDVDTLLGPLGPTTELITVAGFEELWERWPRRSGKKIGKADALRVWGRMPRDDRRAALAAVEHYAAACNAQLTIAQDLHRWLTRKRWVDWQTPAVDDTPPGRLSRDEQRLADVRRHVAPYLEGGQL